MNRTGRSGWPSSVSADAAPAAREAAGADRRVSTLPGSGSARASRAAIRAVHWRPSSPSRITTCRPKGVRSTTTPASRPVTAAAGLPVENSCRLPGSRRSPRTAARSCWASSWRPISRRVSPHPGSRRQTGPPTCSASPRERRWVRRLSREDQDETESPCGGRERSTRPDCAARSRSLSIKV